MEVGLRYLLISIFLLFNVPNAYANEQGEPIDVKQLCELVKKIEQSCATQAYAEAIKKELPVKKNIESNEGNIKSSEENRVPWFKKLLARMSRKKSEPVAKNTDINHNPVDNLASNTQLMPPDFTPSNALINTTHHKNVITQKNTVANVLGVNHKADVVKAEANALANKVVNKKASEKIHQEINKKVKPKELKEIDFNKSEITQIAMPEKKPKDLTSCYRGADQKSRERPPYCYYMMY